MSLPADIAVSCPYCRRRVRHVRAEGETAIYWCDRDGWLALPQDGRLRRVLVEAQGEH